MIREVLGDAWREVLEQESVDQTDDWFASGADSLDSLRLVQILRDRLDAQLPIAVVFQDPPTLEAMIGAVEGYLAASER